MRYLAIDRSTRFAGLAVYDDGRLVVEHVWPGEPARAPEWFADAAKLLADHDVPADSLEGFVCGLGPGSFSGIRACLAALSGLALPGAKPVYGVAGAAALALSQSSKGGAVTVVGDARRNRLWIASYQAEPEGRRVSLLGGGAPSHTASDFQLVPAGDLARCVPDGTLVVSSDWDRLEAVLRGSFDASRLVPSAVFPSPSALGALALADLSACVLEPVPIYLHPAVAAAPNGPAVP